MTRRLNARAWLVVSVLMAGGPAAATDPPPAPTRLSVTEAQQMERYRADAMAQANLCAALPRPSEPAPPCDRFLNSAAAYMMLARVQADWCAYALSQIPTGEPAVLPPECGTQLDTDAVFLRYRDLSPRMAHPERGGARRR